MDTKRQKSNNNNNNTPANCKTQTDDKFNRLARELGVGVAVALKSRRIAQRFGLDFVPLVGVR